MELEEGTAPAVPKLTREQEENLVIRLHDQSMAHRQETLRMLDARFYPTMEPKRLPKEAVEESVTRQVDQEMMKRQAARDEHQARIKQESMPHKVPPETVERSTEWLYTESMQRKKANMEESKKRYLYSGPPVVRKKASEIREYVARLAIPKKREFTVDEINIIYGLATEPTNETHAAGNGDAPSEEM